MAKKPVDKFAARDRERRAKSLAAQAVDDETPMLIADPVPLVPAFPIHEKGKGSPRGKAKK